MWTGKRDRCRVGTCLRSQPTSAAAHQSCVRLDDGREFFMNPNDLVYLYWKSHSSLPVCIPSALHHIPPALHQHCITPHQHCITPHQHCITPSTMHNIPSALHHTHHIPSALHRTAAAHIGALEHEGAWADNNDSGVVAKLVVDHDSLKLDIRFRCLAPGGCDLPAAR